jgi:hypothetical protein
MIQITVVVEAHASHELASPRTKALFLLGARAVKLARPLLLLTAMDDIVAGRARDVGAWTAAMADAADGAEAVTALFSAASRYAGRSALALTRDDTERLRGLGVTWPLTRWALDDFARGTLLLRAAETLDGAALQAVVDHCYGRGDIRERQAVLRALPLLPHPERFLALAADAARSTVMPVFEAIACENPYPAAYFPVMNFNHMVVAALSGGISLDRVVGLGERVTPDLVRLANEWAAERRSASRSVPADLHYLTAA